MHRVSTDKCCQNAVADGQNLETDMDGDEQAVLPHLLAKLLFVLTYNRQIK